jgi:Sodium:dicarboxylate symporter family
LKAIVSPIVFVNVTIAVVEMMQVGAVGAVGGKTIGLYLLTTLLAGTMGCLSTAIFQRWYTVGETEETGPIFITLGCEAEGSYLPENPDGTIECTSDWLDEREILWQFGDYNNTFLTTTGSKVADVSLSDTIYQGIFLKLLTDNIFKEFVDANFAALVV